LPTEAQWEFACRAGTKTRFNSGDRETDLASVAWFSSNSGVAPHAVGLKMPNAFGLYDMHGNVFQWCQELFYTDANPISAEAEKGASRVMRGGAWNYDAEYCRSGFRHHFAGDDGDGGIGFRIVMNLSDKSR